MNLGGSVGVARSSSELPILHGDPLDDFVGLGFAVQVDGYFKAGDDIVAMFDQVFDQHGEFLPAGDRPV